MLNNLSILLSYVSIEKIYNLVKIVNILGLSNSFPNSLYASIQSNVALPVKKLHWIKIYLYNREYEIYIAMFMR